MKIIKCHVINFGTLSNKDYSFKEGMNSILNENGEGKSTLAAFIRVMFFGFYGDGKRKAEENERLKYYPWQGGIYGGNLVFEAGGREYRLERTFGLKKPAKSVKNAASAAKALEESFALYDNVTNLLSDDYSEKIGEELFKIDEESFMNSVYIGQGKVTVNVTSEIYARIGNSNTSNSIDAFSADMEKCDEAIKKLNSDVNAYSEKRKGGILHALNEKISLVEADVRRKGNLEKSLGEINGKMEGAFLEKKKLEAENKGIEEKNRKIGKAKDAGVILEKYSSYVKNKDSASLEYDREKAYFNNRNASGELELKVPEAKGVTELIDEAGTLDVFLENVKLNTLNQTEKEKLEAIRSEFEKQIPDTIKINEGRALADAFERVREEERRNALTIDEKSELSELEKVFKNISEPKTELLELSGEWSKREALKNALLTKKAGEKTIINKLEQEELFRKQRLVHEKEMKIAELEKREAEKRAELEKKGAGFFTGLVLGIILLIAGIVLLALKKSVLGIILMVLGAVISLISFAARNSACKKLKEELSLIKSEALKVNEEGETQEKGEIKLSEAVEYKNYHQDIENDEMKIDSIDKRVKTFFEENSISFNEYTVGNELSALNVKADRFEKLKEKEKRFITSGLEEKLKKAGEEMVSYLKGFGLEAEEDKYHEAVTKLEIDMNEFFRLTGKNKNAKENIDKAAEIRNKVNYFLKEYNLEEKSEINKQLIEIKEHVNSFNKAKENLSRAEEELKAFSEKIDVNELKKVEADYKKMEEAKEELSLDVLNERLSNNSRSIQELAGKINELKNEYAVSEAELNKIYDEEAELEELKEERNKARLKAEIAKAALEYLEKAKVNYNVRFVKPVKDLFDKYYAILNATGLGESDSKYELDAHLELTLSAAGQQRDIALLSAGYRDMVGLCRRFAMLDVMYKNEKPMVILDDPFVNLDDKHLAGAKEFMKEIAMNYQVIYFTCHESRDFNY